MGAGNGYLTIRREKSVSNAMRRFNVLIDDKTIDKIKSGEQKKYAVPGGHHVVRVAIDFYKSKPLTIDLQPNETLELVCGDVAPKTLGESLSLSGIGKSLKALTDPGDYLYVRVAGKASARPEHDDERKTVPRRRPEKRKVAKPKVTLFLSYRREDSRSITGRICDRLIDHFGREAIFRDVDSIPVGMDFRDKIRQTIDQADMLLVVIGARWLTVEDADGNRRLDLAEDYVRLEIEAALAKDIPVVPVLVEEAIMPKADQLPESIADLAYRNALFIPREPYFHAGVDKLIEEIGRGGGGPVRTTQQFCTGCGKPLTTGQQFCTGCGRPAAGA